MFRRLNTGGKPLNNQEIRNCLSRLPLQKALKQMVSTLAFKNATDRSVKDTRLDAQECALRYMYFYDQYTEMNPVGTYDGNMETTLNMYVEKMNNRRDFEEYIYAFECALQDAYSLFGEYTFRKVLLRYKEQKRTQVNKLLMLSVLILLTKHREAYKNGIEKGFNLTSHLAELMEQPDRMLFNMLTWSTNAKANIEYVMRTLKIDLFDKYLSL